ncbi:MAG: hypothetical protein RBT61_01270 [Candidatus Kapabacteria bacterium]|jgi:kynurenine formamidase|nr:hypothetical protein [Candidatus Kapabacteria bacterium]
MIYVIGNKIHKNTPGLWGEGEAYVRNEIYRKVENKLPPVNYDGHHIKPHSLTHAESAKHTSNQGRTVDMMIKDNPEYFYGECLLVKLESDYVEIAEGIYKKEIGTDELKQKINELNNGVIPRKILITSHDYKRNYIGYHDPSYILVLSRAAAEFLTGDSELHLYGTSWKSSDYQPNSIERPIHDILLSKGVIFELLDLYDVPEGKYIFSGMPLYIENSSESPVTPILISI